MHAKINGITWELNPEKKVAEAKIMDTWYRIRPSNFYDSPEKPFEVWLGGVPASTLGVFPYFRTAREAVHHISFLSIRRLISLVDEALELEEALELQAEAPRIYLKY